MVALLIIYFNIQDRSLKTDYLTGVFNRRQLDNYLRYKIQTSSERKSFSAILIDITKFKQINDLYGHQIGDEALQESVKILKKCIAKDDFIARYGGDEFFLILDISDSAELAKIVKCIQQEIELFNSEKKKPYQLKFDMGYTVYDWHQKMQAEDFYRYIDKLMYENKNVRVKRGQSGALKLKYSNKPLRINTTMIAKGVVQRGYSFLIENRYFNRLVEGPSDKDGDID